MIAAIVERWHSKGFGTLIACVPYILLPLNDALK